MDISKINDWVKISIKYTGSCSFCKDKVKSSSYGYWSRSSKLVLHDECYNSLYSLSNTKDVLDPNDHKNKSSNSNVNKGDLSNFINKYNKKIVCYICKKYVDFTDELILSLLQIEKNSDKTEILYCSTCLQNFNSEVYTMYKSSFLQQLN